MKKYKNINRSLVDRQIADFSGRLEAGLLTLDLGAGSGHYRRFFPRQNYFAIDRGYEQQSLQGLDVAADIASLPFPGELADAIICVEVIEHLPHPEVLLKEAHRVLKTGGVILITSPLCYGEHMQPYDYCRYTRFALDAMYQAAGFRIVRREPRGGHFVLLAHLLAKVPDHVSSYFGKRLPGRLLKPLLRLVFTYFMAPLMVNLDFLDPKKSFTLGYCYELCKVSEAAEICR